MWKVRLDSSRDGLVGWMRPKAPTLILLFAGVLVPLWVFGEIADEVSSRTPLPFDEAILRWMFDRATPLLDTIMSWASLAGSGPWVTGIDLAILAVLLVGARRRDALFWALATGGAALMNVAAKHTWGRPRPDLWISIAPETSFSFPSGHTMQSMALAAAVVVLVWPTRWRVPALVAGITFTGVVGISRIYLGVHYPSDVLAGWLASLAWVVGLGVLFHGDAERRRRRTLASADGGS